MTTPFDTSGGREMYARTAGRRIAPFVADALGVRVITALRAAEGPLRLLDIACGAGGLALQLARELPGASVFGVDASPDMIAQAQAQAEQAGLADRVSFAVMDAHHLTFEAASMDAATCNLGLHLLARPAEALAEIGRTLTPGARLWASAPDRQSWREFFAVAHDVAPDTDALLRGFTVKLEQSAPLALALQQAGFSAITQEALSLPFFFADSRETQAFFSGLLAPFTTLPANFLERLGRALDERFPQGLATSYVATLLCARWDAGTRST